MTSSPESAAVPVIIDTDVDIDDWMTILYLLAHPGVEVIGITVVGTGACHLDQGTRNALNLLQLAGQPNVPVARGLGEPMAYDHVFPDSIRDGVDDMYGMTWAPEDVNPNEPLPDAIEFLAETLASGVKPKIVAIGPLTNLGTLFDQHSELASGIDGLWIMGGAVDIGGNVNAAAPDNPNTTAEWNIYLDPVAADKVFRSTVPITLVPLDATRFVPVTTDFYLRLTQTRETPSAQFVYDALTADFAFLRSGNFYFWDVLAGVLLTDPEIATYRQATLSVYTPDDVRSGELVDDAAARPITVAVHADGPSFDDRFLAMLNGCATYKSEVVFRLDGEEVRLRDVDPKLLLIDYLRRPEVGRLGTKLVCGEAGCGACTVMETTWDPAAGRLVHRAVNSCVRPVATLDGVQITTTQGLGNTKHELDPVQYAIAACNGSQCGYCTPGFVMSMYSLLNENERPTGEEIEHHFDGNICRCTGYRPILEGFKQRFACDYAAPQNPMPEIKIDPKYSPPVKSEVTPPDPPGDFLAYMKDPQPVSVARGGYQYFRPVNLAEVHRLKAEYGANRSDFKLVVGNTSIGIYKTHSIYGEQPLDPHTLVDVSRIPDLTVRQADDEGLTVGGAVTLTELVELIDAAVSKYGEVKTRGLRAMKEHIAVVGNTQVRNAGSIAGNIAMAVNLGFLSDLMVCLAALGAEVMITSSQPTMSRTPLDIPKDATLPPDAVFTTFKIPFTSETERVHTYKVRSRPENAHAVVNAAFRVRFNGATVEEAVLVYNGIKADYAPEAARYGGIPFTAVRATTTETSLVGQAWTEDTLRLALKKLEGEMAAYAPSDPATTASGVRFADREALATALFYRMFVHVADEIGPAHGPEKLPSAASGVHHGPSQGQQFYNSYPEELPVSEPLVKLTAFEQASGEARYGHDISYPPGLVEAAYVYSMIARGTFQYVLPEATADACARTPVTAADLARFLEEREPGFVAYITYADINPANATANWVGEGLDDPIFVPSKDDTIPPSVAANAFPGFDSGEIACIGAPLGLVVAEDRQTARRLADYIRTQCIKFEPGEPVLDFPKAVAEKKFFPQSPLTSPALTHIETIVRPGSDECWLANPSQPLQQDGKTYRVVSGETGTGLQNHFYLETMATLAVPGDDESVTMYTSTQTLADNQRTASGLLGWDTTQVRVIVRRDGGAYGGKQTRSRFNSTAAVLAAVRLNRPVTLVLDRNTNFLMCGNRHPFLGRYHAAFDDDGIIHGLDVAFSSDGGSTYDVSFPVMDLAQLSADNVYQIDNFRNTGEIARTNSISNTAFRSFGTIQSTHIIERAIEHVAYTLEKRPEEIREANFYRNGNLSGVGDPDAGYTITRQTIGALELRHVDETTLAQLDPLIGDHFATREALTKAVQAVAPAFEDPPRMQLLEEYATEAHDFTPFLQRLEYCDIRRIWERLKELSELPARRKTCEDFNREHRWCKRGISMMPLRYGVSYTGPRGTLNQGGAYVVAYSADGSVLVHHGGVESGQGIQTKMAQIAAETLDIPITLIRMADTDTSVISDSSPTAASTGSDLAGGAVAEACTVLRTRLERLCEDLEQYTAFFASFDETVADRDDIVKMRVVIDNWREHWSEMWPNIVALAYENRIGLAAGARYRTPHYQGVDHAHPAGAPFTYFTYSAAVSEVELDVLTGQWKAVRTDILYDTGKSLNPLLDVGQIEGAFIQGLGCVTCEEMLYQTGAEAPRLGFPEGAMLSYGTWEYKPPQVKNVPEDLRVHIVDNEGRLLTHKGPKLDGAAVKSSKGIGEPPLVLGNTVFFALQDAVAAARESAGVSRWVDDFRAPATVVRLRAACATTPKQFSLKDA